MKTGICPKCGSTKISQPKLRKRALKHIGLKSEEYFCETCGYVEVYRTT